MTAADGLERDRQLARATFRTTYSRSGQRVDCRVCLTTWWLTKESIRGGASLQLLKHAEQHAAAGEAPLGAELAHQQRQPRLKGASHPRPQRSHEAACICASRHPGDLPSPGCPADFHYVDG